MCHAQDWRLVVVVLTIALFATLYLIFRAYYGTVRERGWSDDD